MNLHRLITGFSASSGPPLRRAPSGAGETTTWQLGERAEFFVLVLVVGSLLVGATELAPDSARCHSCFHVIGKVAASSLFIEETLACSDTRSIKPDAVLKWSRYDQSDGSARTTRLPLVTGVDGIATGFNLGDEDRREEEGDDGAERGRDLHDGRELDGLFGYCSKAFRRWKVGSPQSRVGRGRGGTEVRGGTEERA